MNFKLGDIVRIDEPESFQPHFWNRSFKIIDLEPTGYSRHPWLVVEVIGEPIKFRRRRLGRITSRFFYYEESEITKFEITEDGQKDLILVKREGEVILKNIKKHGF